MVIIITSREKTMLLKTLRSGWGVLIPVAIIVTLGFIGLSAEVWRTLIILGLLLTGSMIWHRELRHFVLLPSCVALIGGMIMVMMNLKLMG